MELGCSTRGLLLHLFKQARNCPASLQNALMFSLVHREQLIDGGLVVEQVVRRAAWKYELRGDIRNLAAANFLESPFFQAMR